MKELTLLLKDKSIELIESYSKKYNISKKNLCEMIVDAWSTNGGLIWSGDYEKSQAFLIDWPSNRKITKIGDN